MSSFTTRVIMQQFESKVVRLGSKSYIAHSTPHSFSGKAMPTIFQTPKPHIHSWGSALFIYFDIRVGVGSRWKLIPISPPYQKSSLINESKATTAPHLVRSRSTRPAAIDRSEAMTAKTIACAGAGALQRRGLRRLGVLQKLGACWFTYATGRL